MEQQPKRLHVLRVRSKGDSQFYDPATDFRQLLPAILFACDKQLAKFWHVLRLRLEEDPTPLSGQFDAFVKALRENIPQEQFTAFCKKFFLVIMAAYSLYVRRDEPLKESGIQRAFMEGAKRMASSAEADELLAADQPLSTDSIAIVQETGEEFRHLREIAAALINADGASWDEAAALCDKEFDARSGEHSDKENIALLLAYPNYNRDLALDLEKEEDE